MPRVRSMELTAQIALRTLYIRLPDSRGTAVIIMIFVWITEESMILIHHRQLL